MIVKKKHCMKKLQKNLKHYRENEVTRSMPGIFDDIKTIECLKNILVVREEDEEKITTKRLDCYAKKLYNTLNASHVVTEWINTIIEEYNKQYDNFDSKEKNFYNQCLYKTIDFFLPFLATYEKMCALINMCSLADDEDEANMDFHQEFFEISVHNATEYANEIHFPNVANNNKIDNGINLLYLLGFFNFRIQNYDTAITYLRPCVEHHLKEINNDESIRLYIRSVIYLAESYEYNKSDLNNALKQLIGIDGKQLKKRLANSEIRIKISQYIFNNYPNISSVDSVQYIKNLYDFFCVSENDVPPTYKVFLLKGVNDSLKSFVHVTAHCLSEYAAECMVVVSKMKQKATKEIRIYSLLQQMSRFLMDWLVVQDDSYVTCQATIRAENDACPEAIEILIKRLKRFKDLSDAELSPTQKMERAELQFYIFYFAEQELNISNNKENLIVIFKQYGAEFLKFVNESKDTNALFHYLVIQFKYLLKKSAQDILQRNESADFTELDNVYYQINECRKSPLPHVFQELFEESNRLINAYLLLREYRYLFRKNPDLCNIKEFYNRLELKSFNTTIGDEELKREVADSADLGNIDDEEMDIEDVNIIKTLIDEIETKKRILILAPVKAAPSCSSDYVPISHLCKLVTRKDVADEFESIQPKFQQVSAEHGKKKGISKILRCDNMGLIKWAIYYDIAENALFIYYSEQNHEIEGEMLRANLNKNEKSHLDELFGLLKGISFKINRQVDCNQEEHKKIYGSGGACTAWMIKGSDVCVNKQLLEILIFSEFDFYSTSHSDKITDDDYIIFSIDEQRAAKYKIVCFNKLPDTKERGICQYCLCVDAEDTQAMKEKLSNLPKQTTYKVEKCLYNGVEIDLNELKKGIEKRITDYHMSKYDKQSQTYISVNSLYNRICKCCEGDCSRKENVNECDLIEACVENKIYFM